MINNVICPLFLTISVMDKPPKLYKTLLSLDKGYYKVIQMELAPHGDLGDSINDRLIRAGESLIG